MQYVKNLGELLKALEEGKKNTGGDIPVLFISALLSKYVEDELTYKINVNLITSRFNGLISWRGVYEDLSFNMSPEEFNGQDEFLEKLFIMLKGEDPEPKAIFKHIPKLNDVIEDIKNTIGKTFTGYKGGDFYMDENTLVHMDRYSEYTSPSRNVTYVDWYNFNHEGKEHQLCLIFAVDENIDYDDQDISNSLYKNSRDLLDKVLRQNKDEE